MFLSCSGLLTNLSYYRPVPVLCHTVTFLSCSSLLTNLSYYGPVPVLCRTVTFLSCSSLLTNLSYYRPVPVLCYTVTFLSCFSLLTDRVIFLSCSVVHWKGIWQLDETQFLELWSVAAEESRVLFCHLMYDSRCCIFCVMCHSPSHARKYHGRSLVSLSSLALWVGFIALVSACSVSLTVPSTTVLILWELHLQQLLPSMLYVL